MTSEQFLTLSGPEIAELASRPLFIPLGSVEQHGPHLPVETDTLIARRFATAAALQTAGLVAPEFNYGYRSQPASGGGELFPGTVSLSGATMTAIVRDLLLSFASHGYREIVLVNGHFENSAFAIEGANEALLAGADVDVLLVNWWELIGADELHHIFNGDFPGWEAEHAGVVETSLMMYLVPGKVRDDLIEDRRSDILPPGYTVLPERPGLVDPSGVLRTAWGSSAQLGESIFQAALSEIVRVVSYEFGDERER